MKQLLKKSVFALLLGVLLLGLCACGGTGSGYLENKGCYICDRGPAKKFVTSNGTDRYYCERHVTTCSFCDKKATKNYTNLLDFHVFVCNNH